MAPRILATTPRPPADRYSDAGYFYSNEVVRILGLKGIDYRQLRRLFRLVAPERSAAGWARFTFRDLAAIRVAIELAGGSKVFRRGRRLHLRPIEAACEALRTRYGIKAPLLEADLSREGNAIVATVAGVRLEPRTGQLVLQRELVKDTTSHLQRLGIGRVETRNLAELAKAELRPLGARRCVLATPVALRLVECE